MFSTLRTRFGIPGVISVMALVFAMLGGAYAAQNNSGGGKATASGKAKKGPRGPRGATGPAGPAGPQGPAGANGQPGAKGDPGGQGLPGSAGADGKTVLSGEGAPGPDIGTDGDFYIRTNPKHDFYGPKGCTAPGSWGGCGPTPLKGADGSPWTVGGTLPPGETETGIYSIVVGDAGTGTDSISFPIPLETGIPSGKVHLISVADLTGGGSLPVGCENIDFVTFAITPDPGHMCVFILDSSAADEPAANVAVRDPFSDSSGTLPEGAYVYVTNGTPGKVSRGTWAVTAP